MLDHLEAEITTMRAAMAEASRIVLAGFELATDVKIVRWRDTWTRAVWRCGTGCVDLCQKPNRKSWDLEAHEQQVRKVPETVANMPGRKTGGRLNLPGGAVLARQSDFQRACTAG
jgi:hypothetical protein